MSTWNIKPGVVEGDLTSELAAALDSARSLFASFGQPFTVTSLSEGQHVANSKHYIGQAADLRTRDVDPATVPTLVAGLRAQLGSGYTVLNEGDHIHVQYNGVGTPQYLPTDLPQESPGFDLAPYFDGTVASQEDLGYSESGISGGVLAGLIAAGIAVYFILRD